MLLTHCPEACRVVHTETGRVPFHEALYNGTTVARNADTCLHHALEGTAKDEVIGYVLSQWPGAAANKSNSFQTPLHVACKKFIVLRL